MSGAQNFQESAGGKDVSWLDAIPGGPFRFRLGTRAGDASTYFAPTDEHRDILAERRHWLESAPQRYAALLPDGAAALEAAFELWFASRNGGDLARFSPASRWWAKHNLRRLSAGIFTSQGYIPAAVAT